MKEQVSAIVLAAGQGKRMNSQVQKQFMLLQNKPVLYYSLKCFQECEEIQRIILVTGENEIKYCKKDIVDAYGFDKVTNVVAGGKERYDSVEQGLHCIEDGIVLIHDGVRPLINSELLSKNIACVKQFGSSITSAIVKETIVEILDDGEIKNVPDRAHSRVAKAPQCFWLNDILETHEKALAEGKKDFIDSCSMMQYYGYRLHMTDGPYENIKITTPDDFYTMRAILQVKEDAQIYGLEG